MISNRSSHQLDEHHHTSALLFQCIDHMSIPLEAICNVSAAMRNRLKAVLMMPAYDVDCRGGLVVIVVYAFTCDRSLLSDEQEMAVSVDEHTDSSSCSMSFTKQTLN